jgi:hypothetical protein
LKGEKEHEGYMEKSCHIHPKKHFFAILVSWKSANTKWK